MFPLPGKAMKVQRYLPPPEWRSGAFERTYDSQISILIENCKLLGWANGSMAIAFVPVAALALVRCRNAPQLTWTFWFCFGGFFCVILVFILSYFAQMSLLKYWQGVGLMADGGDVKDLPPAHVRCFVGALIFTVCSAVALGVGIFLGHDALSGFKCDPVASGLGF